MNTILTVIIVILAILLAAVVALYFIGRNLEKKQAEQQSAIEASKQTVSMLIIDKKKLRIKDSGLPKMVYEQTPFYLRWSKLPIVKAKIGPKIMTLMADEKNVCPRNLGGAASFFIFRIALLFFVLKFYIKSRYTQL